MRRPLEGAPVHRAAGYDTPTGDEKVKAVLSGIRRTIGAALVRKRG
jgi:hypothetical protein